METNQKNGKVTVQIDRTPPPAVANLECQPGENSIIMIATPETDTSGGSDIAEYMYFVDNKAGASDTIVRKTVGTDANPNTATFNTTIGRYLGQVAVVDKAGNVSNVTGNPDARTTLYAYSVSSGVFGSSFRDYC